MKYYIGLIALFLGLQCSTAQLGESHAEWAHRVNPISDDTFELVFEATIDPEWFIYSLYTAEGGSMPSEFEFVGAGEDYELLGKTIEGKTYKKYTEVFEVEETFFKEQALLKQKIRLLKPEVNQLEVILYYQICKEVCILEEAVFNITLDGSEVVANTKTLDENSIARTNALKLDLKNTALLQTEALQNKSGVSNSWVLFGLGFLGGLIALLTPCVFPLIPLTVSFFTKHAQNRTKGVWSALLYGFFIVLIYFLLSLPFHLFDTVDSQILNTIATNIWLNLAFFVIFIVFAFSFFGFYELTLPSSWANKLDNASFKVGGALGIFFMALTLAIVSFSCTGPILGGLLGSTTLANGNVAVNLTVGMTGFGMALALPFALFALFPTWLASLPKSGGWMTTIKGVLGFLELALAFKFLSNADLVGNWDLLKREVFLGIWVVIFVLLTLYLFGILRWAKDNPKSKLSLSRRLAGLVSAGFTVYLILGLTHTIPLKELSGFVPPDFYSLKQKATDCPLGLDCYKDFEEGVAAAKAAKKPILLDFTGWACANCRKMEENVWVTPDIFPLLQEEYVLISLYVDDRKALPASEHFDFQYPSGRIKPIKTIGQKWGTFQSINFNAASQPYYVLLSPNMEVLNTPLQYTDAETYAAWLKSGLEEFR